VDKECIADYRDPKSMKARLDKSIEYLGRPVIEIVANTQYLDLNSYGKHTIKSHAILKRKMFDKNNPNWLEATLN